MSRKKLVIRKPAAYPKFVQNRQLILAAEAQDSRHELEQMAQRVRYRGSPLHKAHPGDFGLEPPCDPRPDKTLCDYDGGITDYQTAIGLLRVGLRRGFTDRRQKPAGWPKYVWAVYRNTAFEAAWTETGLYHGYPLLENDPFGQDIIQRWNNDDR